MRWRRLSLAFVLAAPALEIACSATNGDPVPSELHDAEPVDSSLVPPERDASTSVDEDGGAPATDGGPKDASTDVAPDVSSTSAAVRINEIYVDRGGGGSKVEYVELRGPAGVALDDLSIRVLDDTGAPTSASPYEVAMAGQKMPASGHFTIGGFDVLPDTIISIPAGWDLETKGAVQLLRGSTLIDVVGWTTDPDGGTVPAPGTDPKSTGEGRPYVLPAAGSQAFGRAATGADSDDNRADFCTMQKTPKATNAACE